MTTHVANSARLPRRGSIRKAELARVDGKRRTRTVRYSSGARAVHGSRRGRRSPWSCATPRTPDADRRDFAVESNGNFQSPSNTLKGQLDAVGNKLIGSWCDVFGAARGRWFAPRRARLSGPDCVSMGCIGFDVADEAKTDRVGGDVSSVKKASNVSCQRQRNRRRSLKAAGPSCERERLCISTASSLRLGLPGLPNHRVSTLKNGWSSDEISERNGTGAPELLSRVVILNSGYTRERSFRVDVADRGSIPRQSTEDTAGGRVIPGDTVNAGRILHASPQKQSGGAPAVPAVAVECTKATERLARIRNARVAGIEFNLEYFT